MPRNGSGTSSVVNTFVIDTIADPDEVNANFTDVADQLTNSLPRDGQAGMNAPLPLQNGTAADPALTFTSDDDTGLYRASANKMGVALGGVALPFDAGVLYAAKAGNYTAVATDNNAAHRYTATATVTLTAAATLGTDWHYTVIADGADVTIDPNAAETIDGAATIIIPNGYSALIICNGSAFFTDKLWATVKSLAASAPAGHLYGLTLSNNATDATNDIDIAIGSAASDATSPAMITLASAITKRLDANWAVGTNQGGLDTGAIANDTYHIWLIQRSDTGVVDALFSTSATAPTMPTNYDRRRRVGSIIRASGSIRGFTQRGDTFKYTTLQLLFSATGFGNAALTISGAGPSGIVTEALVNINLLSASGNTCYISDLTSTDQAPSAQVATVGGTATNISGNGRVFTNTSGQFRARTAVGSGTETINVSSAGWVDTRGRT